MSTIAFSQPETVREPHGRSGSFVSDREIANRVGQYDRAGTLKNVCAEGGRLSVVLSVWPRH